MDITLSRTDRTLKCPPPSEAGYILNLTPAPADGRLTISFKPAVLRSLAHTLLNAQKSGAEVSPLFVRFANDLLHSIPSPHSTTPSSPTT